MSAPVDVLAVLDDYSAQHGDPDDFVQARAAIEELIDVANRAAIAATRGDENRPGTIRNVDLDCLRAALARVKPAA